MKFTSHIYIYSWEEGLVFRLDETRVDYNHQNNLAKFIRKWRLDSSQTKCNRLTACLEGSVKPGFIPHSKLSFRSCSQTLDSNYHSKINNELTTVVTADGDLQSIWTRLKPVHERTPHYIRKTQLSYSGPGQCLRERPLGIPMDSKIILINDILLRKLFLSVLHYQ